MQSASTSSGTAGLGSQRGQHLAEFADSTVDVTKVDIRVATTVVDAASATAGTAGATEDTTSATEGNTSFDRAVTVALAEMVIVAADAG